MLGFDHIKAFFHKLRPYASILEAVKTHRDKAVDFGNDRYELLPDLLIFTEFFEEIPNKQTHLFLYLLLDVFNISDELARLHSDIPAEA